MTYGDIIKECKYCVCNSFGSTVRVFGKLGKLNIINLLFNIPSCVFLFECNWNTSSTASYFFSCYNNLIMFVLKIFKPFIQNHFNHFCNWTKHCCNETKLSEENISVCKGTRQENRDKQVCSWPYSSVFASVTRNRTDETKLLVLARRPGARVSWSLFAG